MDASNPQVEPQDPAEERAQRHARQLQEMADIGLELLRELRDQAVTPPFGAPERPRLAPGEAGLAFSRLTRAVRLTQALENRFAQDAAARPLAREAESTGLDARLAAERASRPPARKRRDVLNSAVAEMIDAYAEHEPLEDDVYEEAESLIEDELGDEDVLNRPLPQLIGIICQAIGVKPDWSLWDPAEWAGEDHGLTEAEIAAGCPAPKPPRLVLPPLEAAANDAAAAQGQGQGP
jgi:hypothetical protein